MPAVLDTPLTIDDVLEKLGGVRKSGGQYLAKCPAHEDGNASLTVKRGADGRILLHCHAGCSFAEITAALGVTAGQLFPASPNRRVDGPQTEKHVATYTYVDTDGAPVFQVLRFDVFNAEGVRVDKTFKQKRHVGGGEYEWGMTGVRRVLYRLPELIEAVAMGRTIYVVEGEKDADRLWAEGLAAATAAGGASAPWLPSYSETLMGASVIVLPDNDEPGRKHDAKVTAALTGIAGSVRTVALPGLPEHGDVSDYLDAGHTIADLQRISEEPPAPAVSPFLTARQIEQLPPPRFLVHDMIPEGGLSEIHGPPGSGKSFFALCMACDISLGIPFLGRPVKQGPVVYVAAEGTAGLGARFRAWKRERGMAEDRDVDVFFKRGSVQLLDRQDVTQFIADIRTMPTPPVLVVLDTFARCFVGGEENSAKDMGLAMEAAATIQRESRAAVFLLHHSRKDGESVRGSTALPGAMDAMIAMKNDDGRLRISCEKQKDGPEFAPFEAVLKPIGESCVITSTGAWESATRTIGKWHHKLVVSLSHFQHEGGATSSNWQAASEVPPSTFHRTRSDLVEWSYVSLDRPGRGGRYNLTDAGQLLIAPNSQVTPKSLPGSDAQSLPPNTHPLGGGRKRAGSESDTDPVASHQLFGEAA